MSYHGLDTYNEHSSANPANQDEKESVVSWEVIIDEYNATEFDTEHEAVAYLYKLVNDFDSCFYLLELNKIVDGVSDSIKSVSARDCFMTLKQKIKEHSDRDNGFAWSLLNIRP